MATVAGRRCVDRVRQAGSVSVAVLGQDQSADRRPADERVVGAIAGDRGVQVDAGAAGAGA